MQAHEFADGLQRAAIALENDSRLYNSLPSFHARHSQRRVIWDQLGKLDPTLQNSLRGYDGPCAAENLRRYLVDVWDIDTEAEESPGSLGYAKLPTIEFWEREVREPPKRLQPPPFEQDFKAVEERVTAALYAEVTDHLASAADHFQSLADKLNSLTQKETTMSKIIEVTTKTLVNGIDVSTLTNAQVFDLIAEQENAIKKLEGIDAKPKLLVKEIEDRKAGIAALVGYLDSQVK